MRPLSVLFLCTGNSARSQIAEAILTAKASERFIAASAGSRPAPQVNPLALAVLHEAGIRWEGRKPQSVEGLEGQPWDFVITVCDRAQESCPVFPGQPIMAHWGMPDPAAVQGTESERRAAFWQAYTMLNRRIDLFLALPVEKLERLALERGMDAIGGVT